MLEWFKLVQYLFAGLVASWVFYGLTPYKEPQPFDRIVRALIYTAVIQLSAELITATAGEGWWAESVKDAKGKEKLAATPALVLVLSLGLGFVLALAANNNWPHKWLALFPPKCKCVAWMWKITSQSTHGNNLSLVFETRRGEFVVLVLKNGRRVYGLPELWPQHPDEDFFLLTNYKWLPGPDDDEELVEASNQKISAEGAILIAAKEVDVVEFVPTEETKP